MSNALAYVVTAALLGFSACLMFAGAWLFATWLSKSTKNQTADRGAGNAPTDHNRTASEAALTGAPVAEEPVFPPPVAGGFRQDTWRDLRRVIARRGEFFFTLGQLAYEMGRACNFAVERLELIGHLEAFAGWTITIDNGNRYRFTIRDLYRCKLVESEARP